MSWRPLGVSTRCARQTAVLGTLSLLVLLGFVYKWRQLQGEGLLARFAMISSYEHMDDSYPVDRVGQPALYQKLDDAGLIIDGDVEMPGLLRIQQWLGNQVSKAEFPATTVESTELLSLAQEGGGLGCDAMAILFHDLLGVQGIGARKVQLYRSNFEPMDSHVLVEAQLADGRWVALDPTFNLTFHDEAGRALGAAEIRRSLATRANGTVIPRYHGDRLYPADIEKCYLDWRVLFSNAFVVRGCPDCSLLTRLTPFRFWHGPVRYAFGEDIGSLARQHNRQYFSVVVVYPMLCGGLLLAALWSLYRCQTD